MVLSFQFCVFSLQFFFFRIFSVLFDFFFVHYSLQQLFN